MPCKSWHCPSSTTICCLTKLIAVVQAHYNCRAATKHSSVLYGPQRRSMLACDYVCCGIKYLVQYFSDLCPGQKTITCSNCSILRNRSPEPPGPAADVISCCQDQLKACSKISAFSPHSSHARKASWVSGACSCCFISCWRGALALSCHSSEPIIMQISTGRKSLSALWTYSQTSTTSQG